MTLPRESSDGGAAQWQSNAGGSLVSSTTTSGATRDEQHQEPERKRFHTLDGLRGVAAIFVACYHFGSRNGTVPFPGYLAVDLFFVLSGFVIALNYSDRLRQGFGAGRFIKVRAVRLLPMYMLGFLLGLLKQSFGLFSHDPRTLRAPALICSVVAGSLVLPSPCTKVLFPLNGPSWSLFFEVVINVLFGCLLWRASTRLLLIVIACSFAALILTIGPPLEFNTGWSWPTVHVALFRTSFSFPVGMLIYRYVSRWKLVTWAAVIPLLVMSAAFSFMPPHALVPAEQLSIVLMVFPTIVVLGIWLEAPPRLARLFGFLGDISYPVYALHFPIMPIVLPIFARLGMSNLLQLVAWVAVLVCLGSLAARADTRVRRFLAARLLSRALQGPSATAPVAW